MTKSVLGLADLGSACPGIPDFPQALNGCHAYHLLSPILILIRPKHKLYIAIESSPNRPESTAPSMSFLHGFVGFDILITGRLPPQRLFPSAPIRANAPVQFHNS